ncbi:N-6 DNA methylase [Paenibacillus polymyxa]|uniref:N-6 DNA methylase n=1 Tax=Paenibacillus polymyxa TaxID=1406 RepID=UPI0025B700EF|nr:N-6 DNA methylase [Paenibacillus polymyxa]MDN4106681.1 N-6 DNA methylase [Paenibacillus polymyxa]
MINKDNMYRVERFSQDQILQLNQSLANYALGFKGLPQHHKEVFEKKGWLLPFLLAYDDLLWGRWDYWLNIQMKGTISGSGPIPQIDWADNGTFRVEQTKKMLLQCLSHPEATIDNFAEWLLWGLGKTDQRLSISEKLNEHYYKIFDLFLILDNPFDYLSYLLSEHSGHGYKKGIGYFPTPMGITRMMVEMNRGNEDLEVMKRQTVSDPCVGCGAMLLPASNYYLRAYAQDISGIAVKLCIIQMYFYAPWYAKPGKDIAGFDDVEPIKIIIEGSPRNSDGGQYSFAF